MLRFTLYARSDVRSAGGRAAPARPHSGLYRVLRYDRRGVDRGVPIVNGPSSLHIFSEGFIMGSPGLVRERKKERGVSVGREKE